MKQLLIIIFVLSLLNELLSIDVSKREVESIIENFKPAEAKSEKGVSLVTKFMNFFSKRHGKKDNEPETTDNKQEKPVAVEQSVANAVIENKEQLEKVIHDALLKKETLSEITGCWIAQKGRGIGTIPRKRNCTNGKEIQAGLCYRPCPVGFKGIGPICRQKTCPQQLPVKCGAVCVKNKAFCRAFIIDQTLRTLNNAVTAATSPIQLIPEVLSQIQSLSQWKKCTTSFPQHFENNNNQ